MVSTKFHYYILLNILQFKIVLLLLIAIESSFGSSFDSEYGGKYGPGKKITSYQPKSSLSMKPIVKRHIHRTHTPIVYRPWSKDDSSKEKYIEIPLSKNWKKLEKSSKGKAISRMYFYRYPVIQNDDITIHHLDEDFDDDHSPIVIGSEQTPAVYNTIHFPARPSTSIFHQNVHYSSHGPMMPINPYGSDPYMMTFGDFGSDLFPNLDDYHNVYGLNNNHISDFDRMFAKQF